MFPKEPLILGATVPLHRALLRPGGAEPKLLSTGEAGTWRDDTPPLTGANASCGECFPSMRSQRTTSPDGGCDSCPSGPLFLRRLFIFHSLCVCAWKTSPIKKSYQRGMHRNNPTLTLGFSFREACGVGPRDSDAGSTARAERHLGAHSFRNVREHTIFSPRPLRSAPPFRFGS